MITLRGQRSGPYSFGFSPERALLAGTRIRFSRWGRQALCASALVIAAGVAAMTTRGLPLGIDFAGGTAAIVEFESSTVTVEGVRQAVASLPGDEVVQRYGPASDRRFLVRLPLEKEDARGRALESGLAHLTNALTAGQLPAFTIAESELVSAAIGADQQRRGVYATLASIAAISAYIAVRFNPSFAVGAIAATVCTTCSSRSGAWPSPCTTSRSTSRPRC